jgi:hypothetical protein
VAIVCPNAGVRAPVLTCDELVAKPIGVVGTGVVAGVELAEGDGAAALAAAGVADGIEIGDARWNVISLPGPTLTVTEHCVTATRVGGPVNSPTCGLSP